MVLSHATCILCWGHACGRRRRGGGGRRAVKEDDDYDEEEEEEQEEEELDERSKGMRGRESPWGTTPFPSLFTRARTFSSLRSSPSAFSIPRTPRTRPSRRFSSGLSSAIYLMRFKRAAGWSLFLYAYLHVSSLYIKRRITLSEFLGERRRREAIARRVEGSARARAPEIHMFH